jgi:DNA-binding CsgD family transcriptional regulator/ligand-binding sensor domain-containing protein
MLVRNLFTFDDIKRHYFNIDMVKDETIRELFFHKKINRYKICLVFLFVSFSLLGQFSKIPDTPLIKNFTEEEIHHDLTVFDISQNLNGIMYFATPSGLLEFDGERWENYTHGSESDLRSVLYTDDQHLYTGGHGGFGYWCQNDKGILEYTSLFFKQPTKKASLLPVFSQIKEIDGKILFQTFQRIFIYDPVSNNLDIIKAVSGFNLLFSSKDRAFIQETGKGLFEIKGKELVLIEGTEKQQIHIINVFVKAENELLIITKNNGFWEWRDKVMRKKNWEINTAIEKYLANDAQEIQNNKFIIGTTRKGIYVISSEGKILLHQEKNQGLLDNTIRKIFKDANNNVWLSTENSLGYLQINSNTNYLLDNEGEFGTVYTSYLKDSLLYLGTNQGVFVKNSSLPNSKARLIDESTGQVWEIEKIDNQILVGSHEGVSVLDNKKLKSIHVEGGAWVFKKHPKLNDVLYVGFYSGIGIFKWIDDNWSFVKKLEGYADSSRFMEFDKYGQLWVSHPSKGYYRLSFMDDGMNLKEFEFYGVSNKFVDTYAYFCQIDNELVFYNPKGFFNYDPIDNSFIPQKYASELFKNIKQINSISQNENIFWYSTPKTLGYILRDENEFNNVRKPFYSISTKHLNDFNKFDQTSDLTFAIGIDNGVVFHTINNSDLDNKKTPPIIRTIQLISTTDTIIASIDLKEKLNIPYRNNFVKINIALPNTPFDNSYKIQYRLKGLNTQWSILENTSSLNFPSLSPGSYVLELKSGSDNKKVSKTISKELYVESPWYLAKTAFGAYALLLILINIIYRTYFKRKSQKQIRLLKKVEEEKREREKERFKLEKLEIDKQVLLLKEENLSLEIKKKNTELASSTLNNIKKKELLTNLIEDINIIDKGILNSSLHSPIKKILKKIKIHLSDKDDWLTFELHFRNAHADFFENLRNKHPVLSSNEIKLSAYLKLNLSSKEIASLMNISIRSIEQARYRLRKKLNLPQDSSLVNYIQSL